MLARISPPPKKAIPALIRALNDENSEVRWRSVYALGTFGPDAKRAVPALIETLNDEKMAISTIESLGKIGPAARKAVPALSAMLHHDDEDLRKWVALSLGQIGPEAKVAVPELVSMFDNGDTDTRRFVVRALGLIGPGAAGAVPALIRALEDEDDGSVFSTYNLGLMGPVKREAIIAIGRIGPAAKDAIPHLIRKIEQDEWDKLATFSLGRIGVQAVPQLIGLLEEDEVAGTSYWVHGYVSEALGSMDVDAIDTILQAVRDIHREIGAPATVKQKSDVWTEESHGVMDRVCNYVDKSLRMMGSNAVPILFETLQDENEWVRGISARALGSIRPVERRTLRRLARMLESADPTTVTTAVVTLGRMGRDAVPTLVKFLGTNKNELYRAWAISALKNMRSEAAGAVPALIAALKDESSIIRTHAARALERIGYGAHEAVPALREALRDEDADVRVWSTLALGKIGPAANPAIPELIEILKDDSLNSDMWSSLSKALGGIGSDSVPHLVEVLEDKQSSTHARYLAIDALRRVGTEASDAIPILEKEIISDSQWARAAREALDAIRGGEAMGQ